MEENNKLIAEFMGMQPTKIGWFNYEEVFLNEEDNTFDFLKFHTSWDWLIPVIKKLAKLNPENVGMSQHLNPFEYTIESIYKGVVEYIKSHNYHKNNGKDRERQ